jgi:uncharacterized protein YggE
MDRQVTVSARALVLVGLIALAVVAAYLVGRAGPTPASADTTGETSTVTVTGAGQVAVVPDQLAFDLSVSLLRDDLDQALDDANSAMQAVVDSLKASGVADEDVQTTDLSMYPEYERKQRGQPQVLAGYRVSHSLSVTVEDMEKVSDIVTAALTVGGSGVRLEGLRLQVADPDGSLEPARADAMEQARAKAEEYAANSGRELGEIVEISEVADRPFDRDHSYAAADAQSAGMPIQAGQQQLTADVVVVYELE